MRKFAAALVCAGALVGVLSGTALASTCAQDLNSSKAYGNGGAASDQPVALAPRFDFAPVPAAQIAGTPGTLSGSLIVDQLLKGAISAVGSKATGYALEKLGLGAPDYRAQLDTLESELRAANTRLNELQRFVFELQKSGSEAGYSNLVNQAVPIIKDVKYVHDEIELLPSETPAGQKRLGRSILDYVCEHLLSTQTELNLRLVGTAPNANNLITSSSKAARDSVRYWTDAQTRAVRDVLAYYVDYEGLLLQLRVEWWHAIGSSKEYIVAQIEKVKKEIEEQEKLLKPGIARPYGYYDVGQHYFVDVKHPGLVWWPIRVRDMLSTYSQPHRAELERFVQQDFGGNWNHLGLQPFRQTWLTTNLANQRGALRLYVGKPGDAYADEWYAHPKPAPYDQPSDDAHRWYMPSFQQGLELISGWTGSPLAYLKANSNPAFDYSLGRYEWGKNSAGNEVIWTQATDSPYSGFRLIDLRNGATSGVFDYYSSAVAAVFAVRPADPGGYWYN
jgi:hypothetical protein